MFRFIRYFKSKSFANYHVPINSILFIHGFFNCSGCSLNSKKKQKNKCKFNIIYCKLSLSLWKPRTKLKDKNKNEWNWRNNCVPHSCSQTFRTPSLRVQRIRFSYLPPYPNTRIDGLMVCTLVISVYEIRMTISQPENRKSRAIIRA